MPKPPRQEENEQSALPAEEATAEENGPVAVPASQQAAPKPGRLVLTQEQLINVLRGRMRQAAEIAVREAMEKQFEPALREAMAAIEETRLGSILQVEEASTQQRNTLLQATRSELLERLEERIEDVRVRWDAELDGYRMRAEEILNRVERHTTSARRDLEEAKAVTERAIRDIEPLMASQMEKTHLKAAEEFHLNAAQTADRHLVRLIEESHNIARETVSHMEAKTAEALASVESAARQAFGEFRRQADTHAALTMSDTSQRIISSLASLEAQNRVACDARQQALEGEVSRVGEKITEEFRQSFRAFFYSCLVAAVGAVEEHSKATREGMTPDPNKFLPPKF
jgi:vacuolar-type H+-ATPase subunit E/Vma4